MKMSYSLVTGIVLGIALAAGAAPDALETGFNAPPDSAKPQTWWHWMNGNITKAGITADLEAMKQIGLGGATIVNVDCGIPPGPVTFMSREWQDDFKFAVQEANRLGLKLCVENCAGWSSSGGPWNTVTNAMQCLTASEVQVPGPTNFHAILPQPPVTLGYYRDIAVLAYRQPFVKDAPRPGEVVEDKLEIQHAVYQSLNGSGSLDVTAKLVDLIQQGKIAVEAKSSEMGGDPAPGERKQLKVEFVLNGIPDVLVVEESETLIFPVNARQLVAARKAGKNATDRTFVHPPAVADSGASGVIGHDEVVNLTAKLARDGQLHWKVPPGDWTILRLGYTPTGVENHPAPTEGRGLECDKLSKAALDAHWNGFMQKVLDDIGPLAGKGLTASLIDSYEVGNQDWTAHFRAEFQRRRGYDPVKFLPTFTRQVVDSPEVTERFLWDMRRTVADLFADNYYGHFATLCRQHGLLNAVEPYTGPFESLQCGARADIVMGEFWADAAMQSSVKMAASIAHIYGKPVVGAESFTAGPGEGRWQNDPFSFKLLGDQTFCQGLNRCFFHRYAMQPWTNRWPGMTMGQWGFHFERTVTWWDQGRDWINYISRCEFLLQQGRAVADAAYFTGESAPVEMRVGNPALPAGYDYDAINADVLWQGAKVKAGRIVLASGANYAALVLPPADANLTPRTLKCLRELVRDGATVVGPRPQHSPSLAGYPKCDVEVKKLADELWGDCDGRNVTEHPDGKGRVCWGQPLAAVLAAQHLPPDFECTNTNESRLVYTHRVAGSTDIYFVANQRQRFDSVTCTFRVVGKVPELWHPDTGRIEPAAIWSVHAGRTQVSLNLDPAGSVFVIFRKAAAPVDAVLAVNSSPETAAFTPPKLEIQHAAYVATDGGGERDVTVMMAALVHDGQLVADVKNDALGGDPAPHHIKTLQVDYTLDGKPGHAVTGENEKLELPARPSFGQPPQWETSLAKDGSPTVKAWGNGRVELSLTDGKILSAVASNLPPAQAISGPWDLQFPPNWGAPAQVTLDDLISWTEHTNAGVRYFSGTATYEKEMEVSAERLGPGRELWLDLGAVKNFAEVSWNGQNLGVLWKPPFRVNVTAAVKPGMNRLVVKVTNLWPNRIIGDEQLPADCEWNGDQLKDWPQWLRDGQPSPTGRFTFTTWHHWHKDSPLLESGLLGPVTLQTAEVLKPAIDN